MDGLLAAITGGFVGAVVSPLLTAWLSSRNEKAARKREQIRFKLNRLLFLFDDLNRVFYEARTETAYFRDALSRLGELERAGLAYRFPTEGEKAARRETMITPIMERMKSLEARAASDVEQLAALMPMTQHQQLRDILQQLAEPHDYTIASCEERAALYDKLEPSFRQLRLAVMAKVQTDILD